MFPKDKYTIFDKKERKYRKSLHSKSRVSGVLVKPLLTVFFAELPKWTRVSQRVNPPGF